MGVSIGPGRGEVVVHRKFVAVAAPLVFFASLATSGSVALANVHFGQSIYRFSVQSSNGYRLRLSTYRNNTYRRISLKAENEAGQFARYSVEAVARGGRVAVSFPGLGEIKVRMHRNRIKELPPPKGCSLPTVIEEGTFEGTISFHGEKGFTTVDTDQAPGSIERIPHQECAPVSTPTATRLVSAKSGALEPNPPSHFDLLELTRGPVKVYAEAVHGTTNAIFTASAHERRGRMGIVRVSPAVSGVGDLKVDGTLTGALVAPPAPYIGTATYSGPERATGCEFPCPNPEGAMSGSLRLPLPGLGVVPLTGPEVAATLYDTFREY